ncbi:transthyretin-like family protein [Enemella evansiae]|uniref:hypothetical protein n=1 Tax=Enemella evansiae TaxID=2016499 RepID=UPI000B976B2A|nr:hypothetical protein [Enemella evansiae]OYN96950.1 hypothetical protein CGZ96_11765 [Enemella evansiae]OYO06208.1 hypothetical protein CGZ97_06075 [Enemella evansiae]PFG68939.1 hypothetical protein B0O41_3787 [Propionibacteriaceae bacterium ES.041]
MHRPRTALAAAVAVLALAPGIATLPGPSQAYAAPLTTPAPQAPQAPAPTELEVSLERPDWRLKERIVASGRLTMNGQPVANAPIKLGIDGDVESYPYRVTTGADGTWRFEFWVEDFWGFGEHGLYAQFEGDETRAGAWTRTPFNVLPNTASPTVLTVNPYPAPVNPGQKVQISGSLRRDDNQPAVRSQIQAVVDPATGAREFTSTDEQGNWTLEITVPQYAGDWSREFPLYRVRIDLAYEFALMPAQQELQLTLAQPPPPAPAPTPIEVPTPTPEPTPTTIPAGAQATPTPATPQRRVGAMLLPAWMVNPANGVAVGGVLLTLVGAALISHGRRRT